MHPTQEVEAFDNIFSPLCPLAILDLHAKFYGDRLTGTPSSEALNTGGVAKYSDFGHVESYLTNGTRYGLGYN